MKNKFTVLLTLLFLFPAYAQQFSYNSLKKVDGFDSKFLIESTKNKESFTILDCQSFIHKLDIIDKKASLIHENYIDINECQDLYFKFTRCIKDKGYICIDGQDIFQTSCDC